MTASASSARLSCRRGNAFFVDATSQYALAYALSTTAGLRGFLTLLAASIAAHFGWIHPSAAFAWLGSDGATAVLAVFATLEFLGDKIPAVDHALHGVYFVVRPLAAVILVGATVHPDGQRATYAMMAIGGLNALLVHGSAATARAGSTATTFGAGNVVLSFIEDLLAGAGIVVAFVKPIAGALLALAFVLVLAIFMRAVARRVRAGAPRHDR